MIPLIISYLVEYSITKTMKKAMSKKSLDVSELLEAQKTFKGLTNDIQDAVAHGYTRAVAKYTKKDLDYYCSIKLVPEPTNKRAC